MFVHYAHILKPSKTSSMVKIYTLLAFFSIGLSVSAQQAQTRSTSENINIGTRTSATQRTGEAEGDTLFYFDGSSYYVTNPADTTLFDFLNEDLDNQTVASNVSGSFGPKSAFRFFYSVDSITNDTTNFLGATSWFAPVGAANNWFSFGPITVPANGATLRWQHAMPDNDYRDGYEVLISVTGMVNYNDFTNPPAYTVADNSPLTDGVNDLDSSTTQELPIPLEYHEQQIYIAFHHNANDQFILYLDEFVITEGSTASVNENKSSLTVSQNIPNPANGFTYVNYSLKNASDVKITLFDVTGKELATIAEGSKNAGAHSAKLDLSKLTAGVYYYTVRTEDGSATRKMVVTR